jgi:hypothetical protein
MPIRVASMPPGTWATPYPMKNSDDSNVMSPSVEWNSAPMSPKAAAASNQLSVRAKKPKQMMASMRHRTKLPG